MDTDHRFFQRVFKLRGWLMVPPVLFSLLCHFRETEAHWVFYVGAIGFAMGLALRVWAQIHLRYRLRAKTTLTVSGPYAHVRNPIYIANTLMLVGLVFVSELVWFVPVVLLWCAVVYGIVVRYEEYRLHGKYGCDYGRLRAHVPRWWPRSHAWAPDGSETHSHSHLWASMLAEAHCPLLVIPFVLKELLH